MPPPSHGTRRVVKAYQRDPLVYLGAVPAATGIAMITAIAEIEQQMEAFRLPLLIVHGSADRLTNPEGSKQLYARAGSSDKTFKLYNGLYHEVLNEPGAGAGHGRHRGLAGSTHLSPPESTGSPTDIPNPSIVMQRRQS